MHLAQRPGRVGHVHESERAQHDIEARVGQREVLGIHPLERRVHGAAFRRAAARTSIIRPERSTPTTLASRPN
jgi:hypothetical protein